MATQLFVAFDDLREKPNETFRDMADLHQSGEPFDIKVNLDGLFHPYVPLDTRIKRLKGFGRRVFVDLKMWNGKRTMKLVSKTFVDMGVDFLNVWAHADKQMEEAIRVTEGSNTKILGLTVLSHDDDAVCQKWFRRSLAEAVTDFSHYALEAGCHGIIVPGTTLDIVGDLSTIKAATGLRPAWYKDDRHAQETTPEGMVTGGAHFAVCGSPILKQPTIAEKIAALQKINGQMRLAEASL